MAIAYVNKGTITSVLGSSATPPLPASRTNDNLLIAAVLVQTSGGALTWPAGWTQIDQQTQGIYTCSFAWRLVDGTETAPTITWPSSAFNTCQTFQYSGTSATPISAAISFASGAVATHTSPAITTTANDSLVIYLDLNRDGTSFTTPSGWTSDSSDADAGPIARFSLGEKYIATSGSSSGAISTTGGAVGWVQWQQELLAAVPPGSFQTLQNITGSGVGYSGVVSSATLEKITASGAGVTGSAGSSAASLAVITGSGSAVVNQNGLMSKTPQSFVKTAAASSAFPKSLENFTKSMTGESGVVATRSRAFEPFVKSARSDPFGAMSRSTQYLTRTVAGVSGSVGARLRSMEEPVAGKAGHVQVTGTAAKTLGLFNKSMLGTMGAGANYITVSMHAEKQALTTYSNYPFNSFCVFGGEVYGASDAGLFKLTGATDNGTAIAATVTGGVTDFDDSHLKTIDRAYVGYRSDGDLALSLTQHDDGQTYTYALVSNTEPGIFGRRALTGRGLRARYYQWSISNVDGADFSINTLELSVRALSRRIGGKDA